ncbi:uncharacterized protein EHS24_006617 [Apiotrichum porosum]|uniref:Protein CPL1-like domain-containing protein n=1 Tax=Apiotrichum porosum TaxID=105984 RepID=A0A427Y1U7_9TREE|nr:uncharacterized protein EHS24_006617 [Apiotrichum porosum]RSH85030.1 hypothetical protein EHS24_006617 [Apiotrichum porosum]
MLRLGLALFTLVTGAVATLETHIRPSGTSPSASHTFASRATKVTGCTCCGYDVTFGDGLSTPTYYFILNWANGPGSSNVGWCFEEGVLLADEQAYILEALQTNTSNARVEYKGARAFCDLQGIYDNEACVASIVEGYSDFIVGYDGTTTSEWIETGCGYPPANFVPTDCYCGWECDSGYTKCGNQCIDLTTTVCASGTAQARNLRSVVPVCAIGESTCQVPNYGYACVDTASNLESCGACPFSPASVDCTTIHGVDAVSCHNGKCVAESCTKGFELVDGECL